MDILASLSFIPHLLGDIVAFHFSGKTSDQVTDVFVCLIFYIFIFLFILLLFRFFRANHQLKRLIKNIDALASNGHIPANKRSDFQKLSEQTKLFSACLQEYGGILYATQDVETLSYSLWAPPLLRSRLLPAGAALLTGLGVLGTFVGLLLGLGGLHLDGTMEQLQAEIRQVAQGASVAFETSVWGVFLSLLLTLLEKILSSLVARSLRALQECLASRFPPFPFTAIVCDMQHSSREATDILAGLAEQIGDSMQRSLDSFTEKMLYGLGESLEKATQQIAQAVSSSLSHSLRTELVPSINYMSTVSQKLAAQQAHGAEETLRHLLKEFTTHIGEAGKGQSAAMQTASQEMQQIMRSFATNMSEYICSLQKEQQAAELRQQKQLEQLDMAFRKMSAVHGHNMETAVGGMQSAMDEFRNYMGKVAVVFHKNIAGLPATMETVFNDVRAQQEQMASEQHNRANALEERMQHVFTQQASTLESIEQVITSHIEATRGLLEQGESLQRRIVEDEQQFDRITSSLSSAGQSLEDASGNLRSFGEQISQSIERNVQSTEQAVSVVKQLGEQEEVLARNLQTVCDGLKPVSDRMENVATTLSGSVATAKKSFDSLSGAYKGFKSNLQQIAEETQRTCAEQQKQLHKKMMEEVEALDKQMANLLQEFSKLTNTEMSNRMGAWNEHTAKFCTTMTESVKTIREIVEELEARPARTKDK